MGGPTVPLLYMSTLSTVYALPAETISIPMAYSLSVLYLVLELRQYLQPPCYLMGGLFPTAEPEHRGVICPQFEPTALKVGSKVAYRLNYHQQLSPGDTVVPLWRGEGLAVISNHPFYSFLYL